MKSISFIAGVTRLMPAFLGVTVSMIGAVTAQGASFQLDYDNLQTDTAIMAGGNYHLEGGLGPMPSLTSDPLASSTSSTSSTSSQSNGASADTANAGIKNGGGYRSVPADSKQQVSESASPIVLLQPLAPKAMLSSASSERAEALPYPEVEKSSPAVIAGNIGAFGTVLTEGDEKFANVSRPTDSQPVSTAATALALGSVGLTEAGILSRLAWIARMKNLYGAIPAFIS